MKVIYTTINDKGMYLKCGVKLSILYRIVVSHSYIMLSVQRIILCGLCFSVGKPGRGEKTVKKKKKTSGSWCFHHCYIEKGNDIRAAAGFILNSLLMAKNNTRKVISHSLIIADSNTVDDFPDLLYIAL